ncbi:hypothetical protein OG711_02725 [Streptomyces uncialis]|uniref:hypothetical protein n=1 Tax=Streptomyces uncialis TaxID=1048205 RepID=UPI002E35A07A|nr:hypothetical protein [Streptomyces uncialis]
MGEGPPVQPAGEVRAGHGCVRGPLGSKRRAWELAGHPPVTGTDLARERGPAASHSLYGTEVAPAELRTRMLARHRIIAVGSPPGGAVENDPMAQVKRDTLANHFEACGERRAGGAMITVYARRDHC